MDIRDTIERERITSAAVKQLKATIREESAKHEEEVHARRHAGALVAASGEGWEASPLHVCLREGARHEEMTCISVWAGELSQLQRGVHVERENSPPGVRDF